MSESISRRSFAKASGAALAGSVLAAPGLLEDKGEAHAGQFTGRVKKAVKFQMIQGDLSVVDKFKLLGDLGFDGVEAYHRAKLDPKLLADARDATGLPIHGVTGAGNDLAGAIELARICGASSVLVVAGRVDKDTSYDENYKATQAWIREAIPLAEKHGLRLLIENVWNNFLLSPLEMARYIDEFETETVGSYFDVGNVVRFGWPEQWIRILAGRIGKLDIKEYSRTKQKDEGLWKGFQVEIGDGDCGWPAVRQALAEINYSGWATAEVPGGDRERLKEIAERMDCVLDL
ncbi:MAG: sugar phosphate isomerase/epimerase family protein [Planctomycetota bacterium]